MTHNVEEEQRRRLFVMLRSISEFPDISKTPEELKDDLCIKVSGQPSWRELTLEQMNEVVGLAGREYGIRLVSDTQTNPVEEISKYPLSDLINALQSEAEDAVTPGWGDLVILWNEVSARQNYLAWLKSAICSIIGAISDPAQREVSINDFSREVGISSDLIKEWANTFTAFGIKEVRECTPFDIACTAAKSTDPAKLLARYHEENLNIRQMRSHLRKESKE